MLFNKIKYETKIFADKAILIYNKQEIVLIKYSIHNYIETRDNVFDLSDLTLDFDDSKIESLKEYEDALDDIFDHHAPIKIDKNKLFIYIESFENLSPLKHKGAGKAFLCFLINQISKNDRRVKYVYLKSEDDDKLRDYYQTKFGLVNFKETDIFIATCLKLKNIVNKITQHR